MKLRSPAALSAFLRLLASFVCLNVLFLFTNSKLKHSYRRLVTILQTCFQRQSYFLLIFKVKVFFSISVPVFLFFGFFFFPTDRLSSRSVYQRNHLKSRFRDLSYLRIFLKKQATNVTNSGFWSSGTHIIHFQACFMYVEKIHIVNVSFFFSFKLIDLSSSLSNIL